ncbi:AAA family ATPase [Brevibacillus ginsengisoli]|uniref:AAA family ATPase n=1 Tax=Brevibacillus ginsengisoli TaxID=363854 RepID=UPI003CF0BDCB
MNIGIARKRLLIMNAHPHMNRDLYTNLATNPNFEIIHEATKVEEVYALIQSADVHLILVEGPLGAETITMCQQIRVQYPHITCVAACVSSDLNWEPLLRGLGVWVLPKPIQLHQLEWLASTLPHPTQSQSATQQQASSLNLPDHHSKTKQFITVYGPKGGVGKTFLSRELAMFFTQQQVNGRPYKVLAVDLNLDLGTFATTLNLPRIPNIHTWAQEINQQLHKLAARDGRPIDLVGQEEWREYSMRATINPEDIQKHVVLHEESGLHILTSPREIRDSFEIKDYHLYVMLETLKRSDYDVVLLDTAPDTTDATIQALFFAEKVIMVGNPLVDAIENIHRMLKLLREANYPEERIQICINRMQRKEMYTLEEIRAYFQLHPSKKMFTIPDDEEVKRSINAGKSLMLSTGKSQAKDALFTLGQSFLLQGEEDSKTHVKSKQPSWFSKWVKPFKRGGVH